MTPPKPSARAHRTGARGKSARDTSRRITTAPLSVLTFVRPTMVAHLRGALGASVELQAVHDATDLIVALRTSAPDAVFLDPTLLADAPFEGSAGADELLARALRQYPPACIRLYTTADAGALRAVRAFVGVPHARLLLRGVDDAPSLLRSILEDMPRLRLARRLDDALGPTLIAIETNVGHTVRAVVTGVVAFESVDEFAYHAGVPRRTFDATLRRCSLAPGDSLLRIGRVVRVAGVLRDSRMTLRGAAEKLGYTDPRRLARDVMIVTGHPASSLRRTLDDGAVVTLVVKAMRTATSTIA